MARDALVDLKKSMDKQIELQEQNNAVLRLLIATLEETAEAAADLTEALNKNMTPICAVARSPWKKWYRARH